MADPQPVQQTQTGEIVDQTPPTTASPESSQTTAPSTTPTEPEPLIAEEKPPEEPAPAKYADYKLPEGFEVDEELLTEANDLFKSMKLSQSNAQKLMDLYVKTNQEALEAPYKAFKDLQDKWREEAMSHPDLKGKLGPGKEISVRIAKALNGLNDPQLAQDFRQAMDLTGAGNNPAFIRVIAKLASAVTEGSHVAGNGPSPMGQSQPGQAERSAAQTIWPSLPTTSR
jgi:hypothetical protein